MKHLPLCFLLAVSLTSLAQAARAVQTVTVAIDFEELPLDSQNYYNGSDLAGGFESHGTWFNNQYAGYWMGWAYSQTTDTTTAGPTNQYSAYTGSGSGGSAKYGVAYNGLDSGFGILPEITLPTGAEPQSVQVTNTTYAALSMIDGDQFAKQFGGPSGSDPDYFLLTVEGLNALEAVVGSVDIYLADYRFSDPNEDYVLDEWMALDLSPLAGLGVEKLSFRMQSSDNGIFGMNTPAYVAIDNLEIDVIVTPGDFDLNGTVDPRDLAIWQDHYGSSSGVIFTDGDADENGIVDGRDFLIWQRNARSSASLVLSLPEPSTFLVTATLAILSSMNSRTSLAKHL